MGSGLIMLNVTRPVIVAILVVATALSSLAAIAADLDSPYRPAPGKYPRFDSKQAEPGIAYGQIPDFRLPKTLLYSVSPEELLADAEAWAKLGFQGFFLTGVAPEWSADVWSTDKEPWTIGESDKTFQIVRQANGRCRWLACDVFLTMSFSHTFEWFNDLAWQRIEDNFRQFAVFARDTGCTGVAIDVEYIYPQYHFDWEGYTYDSYSRKDLVEKIRARMTRVAAVMYDQFPQMVLLTLPEGSLALGGAIQSAWIEEAAQRKAPGGVHVCTEYTYRRPNIRYMFGHTWLCNRLYQMLLSERGKDYWIKKCSIAEGIWPFGIDADDYHGAEPSLDEFRQAFAASLMVSRKYNWIYSHNLRQFMMGRDAQGYAGTDKRDGFMGVIAARETATNPDYVRTTEPLRDMLLRDYAPELGLTLVPTFAGPREEIEVSLMPENIYAHTPVARLNQRLWDLGLRLNRGEVIDLAKELGTQTHWMLLGPFDNKDKQGYAAAYPPEKELDLASDYDGASSKIRWIEYRAAPRRASIDLTKVFHPTEQVCAYALCFVVSDQARDVQIRVGANDAWKLWVGGAPAYENPEEGRIILDRDIVPVNLPAGMTPILLKICNNRKDWGFIFRVTDADGMVINDLKFQINP